ncbi:beta-propeller fold lactonase family protein [Streptomyces tropicalis]|uniref:Beta-propeller fold lactonase family protein n=1 Tax=Streptomyces tropicalis TaxID=3034234 RepID=A0ABT6ACQ2_9ACTN|nr:beta-propeller fold lactonase family protein [Streptomyces tropicalis]MDF3302419.1 beta-propeller fold lactonase family protein [Streptomyces tropicalis]
MHPTTIARVLIAGAACLALSSLAACTGDHADEALGSKAPVRPQPRRQAVDTLPGMPPVLDPSDVYSADRPGQLSPVVKDFPSRVYVPNTISNTVTVIDPATYKIIETIPVGRQPQHVVPSWDLKTLWVNNDLGNSLTPIDPRTGRAGKPVDVHDPYNLYFTPDGKYAVVMASADRRLVFRDAHSMKVVKSVPVDCYGVNHADFSTDGRYFIVSCEFSGELLKVDTAQMKVVGQQKLPYHGAMPQDVKMSPDGKRFYIADMVADGMWIVDGATFGKPVFLPTGKGAHGLYVSRDSRVMYVSNRGEGTISLFDFAHDKLVGKWHLPGGGSPDMGGVSADGKVLWLSGRYNSEVYAIDTRTGRELARIKVGRGPHGLAVYPQPGRYSLGHTGIFR